MPDPLSRLVNEHTWSTITALPGARHRLIPIGQGELFDWTEDTGDYRVWLRDQSVGPTDDPYPAAARTSGTFSSIRTGHVLVWLADTPGSWFTGGVLDWVPATLGVRIWRMDRSVTAGGDPLPTLLDQASFSTIGAGHQLIYLDHDRVLDWEPASGRNRVWTYDRSRTSTDPLPTKVTESTWSTVRTGHQLAYLGGDLVLDWDTGSGDARVWRYDRALTGDAVDPLPLLAARGSFAGTIDAGRQLIYLGGDEVLDWNPATGHERIWDLERPMMPSAQFDPMLAGDLARARTWVATAQAVLVAYQAGLASGVHDITWAAADAALATHFHVASFPGGVAAAVTAIQNTYGLIQARLTTGTASITQVAKAQAVTDLGGLANYTRGYTVPGVYTRLTPAYRPFDTIGSLGLDGAGDRLRAAILIHETAHFVGDNPDFATEWQPGYATLTGDQAVRNASSYAAFAHNVLTGEDLRFGQQPWR